MILIFMDIVFGIMVLFHCTSGNTKHLRSIILLWRTFFSRRRLPVRSFFGPR